MNTTQKARMCGRKKAFPSELSAIRGAIASSAKFARAFRVYRCPVCKKWHITTQTK